MAFKLAYFEAAIQGFSYYATRFLVEYLASYKTYLAMLLFIYLFIYLEA